MQEYSDILEDMREESGKYGPVRSVLIPRPAPPGEPQPPGLGKVVIEFDAVDHALLAHSRMHGRKFALRTVIGTFLTEDKFAAGIYE